MGYLRDQDGIMSRYMAEKGSWDPHLERTREFIAGSFAGEKYRSVAVLGSGWLLDVPLENLRSRFLKVILVDIFHPPQIVRKVRDMKEVELLEADLTGGVIGQVWQIRNEKGADCFRKLTDSLRLESPLQGIRYDAVISVNLLNQLDILLVDYLKERGCIGDEPPDRLREILQSFHLHWITGTPGCLVSDVWEENTDNHGKVSAADLLFTALPEGSRNDTWNWDFDSRGNYRRGCRTKMTVRAVEWP